MRRWQCPQEAREELTEAGSAVLTETTVGAPRQLQPSCVAGVGDWGRLGLLGNLSVSPAGVRVAGTYLLPWR